MASVFLRPISLASSAWTVGTVGLINESTPDDGTYIYSNSSGGVTNFYSVTATLPANPDRIIFRFRQSVLTSGGAVTTPRTNQKIELRIAPPGGSFFGTFGQFQPDATWTQVEYDRDFATIAAVGTGIDLSNFWVGVYSFDAVNNKRNAVSWIEIEITSKNLGIPPSFFQLL